VSGKETFEDGDLKKGLEERLGMYLNKLFYLDKRLNNLLRLRHECPSLDMILNSRFVLLCSRRSQSAKASVTGKQV
jgi:hypothetical protein